LTLSIGNQTIALSIDAVLSGDVSLCKDLEFKSMAGQTLHNFTNGTPSAYLHFTINGQVEKYQQY